MNSEQNLISKIAFICEAEQACFSEPWSFDAVNSALRSDSCVAVTSMFGYALGARAGTDSELYRIAVLPEHRGRGEGAAILKSFIKECGHSPNARVFLEVRAKNTAAIALYRKAGFVKYHERKAYYGDDDAVLMKLETEQI